MKLEPFRIEPEFSARIWGARSLAPLYPEMTNLAQPIGEAWLTGFGCRVATGPFAGRDLRSAWQAMSLEWRGERLADVSEFPILVKFIFPNGKLSIQVHPDDAYASAHEQAAGGKGKTEMWHAVSAQPGAQVLIGLKSGTDRQEFLDALSAGTLEKLFEALPVRAGDTFFLPAGTPHTIGPGMILCEVQEYSDLTYRVYDYGRVDAQGNPRELQVEKALAVMSFGDSQGGKMAPLPLPAKGIKKSLLAACRYFAAERWDLSGPSDVETDSRHCDVFAILSGSGEFAWNGGASAFHRGECWFVPAGLGSLRISPRERAALLRTYLPDLPAIYDELRHIGARAAVISKIVFD